MSKELAVLNYLKANETLTPQQAMQNPLCNMRLASSINRLRLKGWKIRTDIVRGENKQGKYCYGRYVLLGQRRGIV
jgi:hypothetical protein